MVCCNDGSRAASFSYIREFTFMPTPCSFNISKENLDAFRAALQAASSSQPGWWSTWETCWVKVSETLDQAESRAYEAADTDAAKQCCRLNRLIQTCLSPTWEMVSADPNPEKTILCAVSDWTDDWSRFKHCLTGYHMEEFRTVAADLKRLQEYLMLLPEASWAYAAETQVLLLLADCEALHPQGT